MLVRGWVGHRTLTLTLRVTLTLTIINVLIFFDFQSF